MELRFSDRYGVLLCRTATHIYLRPHPDLSRRVAHYTLHLGSGAPLSAPSPLVLVPDASGCLVFTLEEGRLFGRMYGPSTAAVSVVNDLRTRPFRFLVEFLPGALAAATHIPQWELADRVLPLALTAPGLDGAFARLWRAAPDLDEFIAGVDALLLSHLAGEDGFASLLTLACRREGGAGPGGGDRLQPPAPQPPFPRPDRHGAQGLRPGGPGQPGGRRPPGRSLLPHPSGPGPGVF